MQEERLLYNLCVLPGVSILAPLLQYRNFEQILLFKTQRKQLNSKSLAWSPFRKEFQSELQKKLTGKKLYKLHKRRLYETQVC